MDSLNVPNVSSVENAITTIYSKSPCPLPRDVYGILACIVLIILLLIIVVGSVKFLFDQLSLHKQQPAEEQRIHHLH